jgi:hypothetical protein
MPASAAKVRRAAAVETVELTALLSVAEVCDLLGGLNPKTVMGYIKDGELPAVALGKNGGKPYGVEVADFVAFKEARRVRPSAAVVELAPEREFDPQPGPVAEAASRRASRGRRSSGSRRRRASIDLVAA